MTGGSRREQRPAPRRRRGGRAKMPMGMAMTLIVVALLLGVLVGYAAHGDDDPAGLLTETREVPVVTVTTPAP